MAKNDTMVVNPQEVILLPQIPNFLRTEDGKCIPLTQLSKQQLKAIGNAWTNLLIQKSKV